MYKLVLFDLDGTILDTVPDIQFVLNLTLKYFGLPEVSESEVKAFVGDGAYMLVRRACGNLDEEEVKKVHACYAEKFAECDNSRSAFFDGEDGLLIRLKESGVKVGIITNKPHKATLNVYDKFFKKYDFFFVQGQCEGAALKPDPSTVFKAIKLSGVKKSECLFVGDGETDIRVAKNAGVDCASVLWGYRSRAQLEDAGAEIFVENFDELGQIIFEK